MPSISTGLGMGACIALLNGDIPISVIVHPGPDPDPTPNPDPDPKPDPKPDPNPSPGPAPELVVLADHRIEIGIADGIARLTIGETGIYDGQYDIDASALAIGPVNLVPAKVEGTTEPGDTLTSRPGLWVRAADRGPATIFHRWHRNGTPIQGAEKTSYIVGTADRGATLTMVETVTDTAGQRAAASNGHRVAGGIASPVDLGAKLVVWLDAADPASLSQDAAGERPVTATGQPVMRIADKSPRGNHATATGIHNPGQGARAFTGIRWQDASFVCAQPVTGMTDGMEVHVVLEPGTESAFCLLGHNRNTRATFGVARGGVQDSPSEGFTGAIKYSANGKDLANEGMSQNNLFAAWSSSVPIVIAGRGWSGTADESLASNLLLISSRNTEFRFGGIVRQIVVTQALSDAERAGLTDYLIAEASR